MPSASRRRTKPPSSPPETTTTSSSSTIAPRPHCPTPLPLPPLPTLSARCGTSSTRSTSASSPSRYSGNRSCCAVGGRRGRSRSGRREALAAASAERMGQRQKMRRGMRRRRIGERRCSLETDSFSGTGMAKWACALGTLPTRQLILPLRRTHTDRHLPRTSSLTRFHRTPSCRLDLPCRPPSLSDPARRRHTIPSHPRLPSPRGPRSARLLSTVLPTRPLTPCTILRLARSQTTTRCTGRACRADRLTLARTTRALPSITPALLSTTLSCSRAPLRLSAKRLAHLRLSRLSRALHPPNLPRFGRTRPSRACSPRNTLRHTRASRRACSASTKA